MNFLIKLLITWVGVILASYLLPGIHIQSFTSALWVAMVLAFLNVFLKPILVILTIPVTILTFGLFLLIINAVLVLIADDLIGGFYVDTFGWAILFSIILSIITYILGIGTKAKK